MIELYSHEKHYETLSQWLRVRNIVVPHKDLLPEHGYCVDDCAIGFLILPNSKAAQIDNVAADPAADKQRRDAALTILLHKLEDDAQTNGRLVLSVLGRLPAMKRRFESMGYGAHGEYTLYCKVPGGGKCLG